MIQPINQASINHPPLALEPSHAAAQVARVTGQLVADPSADLFARVERAKQEWEATVDSLPELICLLDMQGRIVRANRMVEAWGLTQVTQVAGLHFHDLLHVNCEGLFCNLRQFLDSAAKSVSRGQVGELETYDSHLNRYVRIRLQPVATQHTAEPNAVVVVEDITRMKQNEEALRRYASRLESISVIGRSILAARSPEDIAHAALSHVRALVPFRYARVMLYQPETDEYFVIQAQADGEVRVLPGRSMPAPLFSNNDQQRRPDRVVIVTDLAALIQLSDSEEQLLGDGLRSYISFPMVTEGQFVGAFGLAADRPNAFYQEHIEIAHEVADLLTIATHQSQLYRRINQANQDLQAALCARDEMIQNVSHELRTPLSVIYGYTALLEDRGLGEVTDDQLQVLRTMLRQEERLRFMVDRLVLLRTFESQQLHLVQVPLSSWLSGIVNAWLPRAASAHMSLSLDAPATLPHIEISPDHLQQVIDNLLDNALKFGSRGSSVEVRARTETDTVIISVTDHGTGIPVDKLKHVFERFYQVDGGSTRHFGGMGIGLALCEEIVAAHGGRIWVKSPGVGQGSTFFVALPLTQSAQGGGDKSIT